MKIIVFGATGLTGREVVKQALAEGHQITAFVRSPDKMKDIVHENLRVLAGDVLDSRGVEEAVAGHDVVVSTIGTGAKLSTLREDGTRIIVEAMAKQGVKRLISLSSLGVGDSRSNLDFFTKHIVVGIFLRHAFADHERQEAVVRQSALDWTIVRPPHLTNGSYTGDYQHGFPTAFHKIKGKISRADVANFIVKQLTSTTYIHQTPGVSY